MSTITQEKADKRPSWSLELGVNFPEYEGRTCAVEVGPFRTVVEAAAFAKEARGKNAASFLEDPRVDAFDLTHDQIKAHELPIIGCTLAWYNNTVGTYDQLDVY